MANGLPYAIAAQIAYPDRQVVAFVGDGGFSMLMAELATCVKYQLPVKIVVIKNNTLGMIKWEQMVFLGNPEYGLRASAHRLRRRGPCLRSHRHHHRGPRGVRGGARVRALATPGPVVVQAVVDPLRPPLPPKVTLKQAARFAQSLASGQANREKIALTVLGDRVRELV